MRRRGRVRPRIHALLPEQEDLIKHTSLFRKHREAGASLEDFHGWAVPGRFRSPEAEAEQVRKTAGLGDWSWMAKFDLKGFALKTPPALDGPARCWRLRQCHYLVTCEPAARDTVRESIRALEQFAPGLDLPRPVYCTDVTSVYADFLLAGPRSRDVLGKLCSLNVSESALPNLSCGQTALAEVHSILLRQDLGAMPAFHLLVARDYSEFVWDAVLHSGEEFGMTPFGLKTCKLLNA